LDPDHVRFGPTHAQRGEPFLYAENHFVARHLADVDVDVAMFRIRQEGGHRCSYEFRIRRPVCQYADMAPTTGFAVSDFALYQVDVIQDIPGMLEQPFPLIGG